MKTVGDISTQGMLKRISDLESLCKELADELGTLAEVYDAMGAPRGPSRIKADAALTKYSVICAQSKELCK